MRRGYSLIELIVVVAISIVVIGGVIVNYATYNQRETVQQAALTLKNNFRVAQTKASAAEKPSSGCTTLLGYTVSFTSSSYQIQAECSEGPVGETIDVTFTDGVEFSSTPTDMTFSTTTALVSNPQSISLTSVGGTYQLTVLSSGIVEDDGFQ